MIGEWFWRFLAVVMLLTVGWVLWIIYQINPQPLITNAGFRGRGQGAGLAGCQGRDHAGRSGRCAARRRRRR